ncbi:uncharacterized protein VTP21DRAFT_11150 [Calcarisporiella thermophila]|uniref:uncharacterized protein n=1 Tax=Calcarisporiella thermophila TaxID=911321 RepID=UPI0037429649
MPTAQSSSHSPMLVCQRCKQPLRMDESLNDLSPAALDLLLGPLSHDSNIDKSRSGKTSENSATPPTRQNRNRTSTPTPRIATTSSPTTKSILSTPPSESFVMLSQSQLALPATSNDNTLPVIDENLLPHTEQSSLSYRIKVAQKLFELMNSRSDIAHPMCLECTDTLLEGLGKQLADASRERDSYIEYLKRLNANALDEHERELLAENVEKAAQAEQEAIEALKSIEREHDALKEELARLNAEAEELENIEQNRHWQEFNAFHSQLYDFHNQRDSVNLKYDHDSKQLDRLQKADVYNDTFCISHNGYFGTINGFRLGRLPNHPVEWSEINAAWGQALLLLYTLAKKLNFNFKTYRLIPLGSFSRIEKIEGDFASYELYGSGDLHIGRLFLNRRFDLAMVAFLNCLQQLGDYAEQQDPNLKLPYRINKDKIGDVSIRLQFNHDEIWTKALKYTLTNAKWILAFVSSSTSNPNNALSAQ